MIPGTGPGRGVPWWRHWIGRPWTMRSIPGRHSDEREGRVLRRIPR